MDSTAFAEIWTLIATYGLQVMGAIVVLIVGWMAAGMAARLTAKGLAKTGKLDETLTGFLSSLAKYLVLIIMVIMVLNLFGVQTTSLIAVLGAASLAIGLAFQGTLSNIAAGVMLLLFRPFKVNDYIEGGGQAGTVKAIATRRVDMVLGISYEDDVEKAVGIIEQMARDDGRVMDDPAPQIVVGELADSSVNIVIRLWCQAGDYWGIKFDMTKALKLRMDGEGISIPYPQRTLHVIGGEKAGLAAE
jgi:small conductance mechanosensitive channel